MTPAQPGQPDLAELRRLAEAATEAEANPRWVTHDSDGNVSRTAIVDPKPAWALAAAANPTVVLALLSRIEALETALRETRSDAQSLDSSRYEAGSNPDKTDLMVIAAREHIIKLLTHYRDRIATDG